ncbi:lytic transglycosylase domain-containing protein [Methylocapsa sp. S129]|uniref:lytic transglycosylase domain-containing protein n=1 Tax=Methylocapsa sp. S129 TaxID=1641869 RepID=UPI001FF00CC3|nr:lytic transglycosylase domain-containing protein [Methylocapsa sp. S129]
MQSDREVPALPLFAPETNRSSFPVTTTATTAGIGGVKRTRSLRVASAFEARPRATTGLRSLARIVGLATILVSSTLLPDGIAHAENPSRVAKPTTDHAIDRFEVFIAEASRRFDVPIPWIRAVMHVESVGDVRARSPKGAMGLMQIMPETYATLRARYALGANPYEPRDNILAGAACLRELHDRYGAPGFLAAYNAGPRRYEEHLLNGRPLPLETQRYVAMLAPIVGGGQMDDRPAVVADVGAWFHSLLFPARPGDKPAGDKSLFAASPERQSTVRAPVDLTGLAPQSGELFVHRIAEFQPQ